jgi:hypothetical protein
VNCKAIGYISQFPCSMHVPPIIHYTVRLADHASVAKHLKDILHEAKRRPEGRPFSPMYTHGDPISDLDTCMRAKSLKVVRLR